jgi:hypothetical protein
MQYRMRWFAWLVLLSALTGFAQSPSPTPTSQEFAGTWRAEFHKQTWLVLTLVDTKTLTDKRYAGEILTGTLTHATEISSDDEGDITKVGDEMSTDKIVRTELQGETLLITGKDEDGNEDQYKFVLTGKDSADLQPVTTEGTTAPKAFKLKRSVPPPPPQK